MPSSKSNKLGSIIKTVMNDVLRYHVGTVSQTVRSGNGPYMRRIMLAWRPSHGFLHHTIGAINDAMYIHAITIFGMVTISIWNLIKDVIKKLHLWSNRDG